MGAINAKHVYATDEKGTETGFLLATIHPANEHSITTVITANPLAEDGFARSPFMWIRLQNGDLILGCYPQDDTYFATEADHSTPVALPESVFPSRHAEFVKWVEDSIEAGFGDSNDAEIDTLKTALGLACDLLGVNMGAIEDRVEAKHNNEG